MSDTPKFDQLLESIKAAAKIWMPQATDLVAFRDGIVTMLRQEHGLGFASRAHIRTLIRHEAGSQVNGVAAVNARRSLLRALGEYKEVSPEKPEWRQDPIEMVAIKQGGPITPLAQVTVTVTDGRRSSECTEQMMSAYPSPQQITGALDAATVKARKLWDLLP